MTFTSALTFLAWPLPWQADTTLYHIMQGDIYSKEWYNSNSSSQKVMCGNKL